MRREVLYVGHRPNGEAVVKVLTIRRPFSWRSRSSTEPLPHIVRHRPDGLEWGYPGSGPADLSRSILTHAVGQELADKLYMQFKFDVICGLPRRSFVLSQAEVLDYVQRHRPKEGSA